MNSGQKISCLLYADDLVITSEDEHGLQTALNHLKTYCVKWNLEINTKKTKIMIFNKAGRTLNRRIFSLTIKK